MEEVVFDVKYEAGHSYPEKWIPTQYFCPNCGTKYVWMRDDGGDYYLGEKYLCVKCGGAFYLPSGVTTEHIRDWQYKQRHDAFKAAFHAKPYLNKGNG